VFLANDYFFLRFRYFATELTEMCARRGGLLSALSQAQQKEAGQEIKREKTRQKNGQNRQKRKSHIISLILCPTWCALPIHGRWLIHSFFHAK